MSDFYKDFVKEYNKLAEVNNKELIKEAGVGEEDVSGDSWYDEYEGEDEQNAEEAYMPEDSRPRPTETTPIKAAYLSVEKALADLQELEDVAPLKEAIEDLRRARISLYKAYRKGPKEGPEWSVQ